ncbi:MAG: hypothetical protein R2852_09960 [Bacteroidia bacterium]
MLYLSSLDNLAFSVVPGWNTTLVTYTHIWFFTCILVLLLNVIGYWLTSGHEEKTNWKVFAIHLALTLPIIVDAKTYLFDSNLLSGDEETLSRAFETRLILSFAINTLFILGQIVFLKHLIKTPKLLRLLIKAFVLISGGIILLIAIIWTIEWYIGTHYYNFKMQDRFEVELKADECGTCFMDWQIEYNVEITDLKNEKNYEYKFFSSEGPYIRFCLSKEHPELILIQGYGKNDFFSHLINLNRNTIESVQPYLEIDNKGFVPTHELTNEFELLRK